MPKRSERQEYADKFEEGNPYSDYTAQHLFKVIRWGNKPKEEFEINAPEDMACMGLVAKIFLVQNKEKIKFTVKNAPFLAVGLNSNYLYIVSKNTDGSPVDIPLDTDNYDFVGNIKQIDYYSDKNNEEAYYYHKHEKPYPFLYVSRNKLCIIIIPAELNTGHPSYIVREEGIIG